MATDKRIISMPPRKTAKPVEPKPAMSKQELVEQLADREHESWARWMQYLLSLCKPADDGSGSLTMPADCAMRWQRQIDTPYADLSEQEKESDRAEVRRILPIIRQYAQNEQPAQPFPVRVNLVLMLDAEPALTLATAIEMTPPPDGEGVAINWPADARQLAQALEQVLGPAKSVLWTPKD